jgi:hypothetical protein
MRGIAIPWGKCNIFKKKKPFILYFIKKKKKPQTKCPASQYMEPGVVAATPEANRWSATHGFFFFFLII